MRKEAVFTDVEQLLFKGFIQQKAKVGDLNFVFKTVSLKEVELIDARAGFDDEEDFAIRFSRYFTAYSIYILDGENVLSRDRENFIENWYTAVEKMPELYLRQLLLITNELNRRAQKAFNLVEPYSYEDLSRYYWRAYKGKSLNSFEITGVPGTNNISMNEHQIYWSVLNQSEDKNITYETDWSFAKFIAGAFNPKGVQKVDQRDKTRRKQERQRRERIKERLAPEEKQRFVRTEAWTAEELQDQLMNWVEGRKDLHDELMEEFENQQRQLWDQKQQELHDELERRRELYDRENQEDPLKLIPVDKASMQKHIRDRVAARNQSLSRMPNQELLDKDHVPKIFKYHEAEAQQQPNVSRRSGPQSQKADVSPSYTEDDLRTVPDPRAAAQQQAPQPPTQQPPAQAQPVQAAPQYQAPQPKRPTQVDTAPTANPRLNNYLGIQETKKRVEDQQDMNLFQQQKAVEIQEAQQPQPEPRVPQQPSHFKPIDPSYITPGQTTDGVTRVGEKRIHGQRGVVYDPNTPQEPQQVKPLHSQAVRNQQLGVGPRDPEQEAAIYEKGELGVEQQFDENYVENQMLKRGLESDLEKLYEERLRQIRAAKNKK